MIRMRFQFGSMWLPTMAIFGNFSNNDGPLKNNIHRIKSAIVNKRTISEMKIKIYCLRVIFGARRTAEHWPKNMFSFLYLFFFFSFYCYCVLMNKYLFYIYEKWYKRKKCQWKTMVACVRLLNAGVYYTLASPAIFHQKLLKRKQRTKRKNNGMFRWMLPFVHWTNIEWILIQFNSCAWMPCVCIDWSTKIFRSR